MEREEVVESTELLLNLGLHGVGQLLNCFKLQSRVEKRKGRHVYLMGAVTSSGDYCST